MELYYNGHIYTMTAREKTVSAVLVDNGRIIETFDEIPDMDIAKIDLAGSTMFPGFVDTHFHLVGTGIALNGVNFKDDTDINIIKEKIRTAAQAIDDKAFLICEGYNENQLGGIKITNKDIDAITDKKVIIKRVCRHAAVVSSSVLNHFNIKDSVEDMPGGQYEKVEGMLNGWLHDNAMELILEVASNEDEHSLTRHVDFAVKALEEAGLTGVHTEDLAYYNSCQSVLNAYKNVINEDNPFRLNILRHTDVIEEVLKSDFEYNEFFRPDAMKFYADGALGGRTALFSLPYSDDDTTNGLAIYTPDELAVEVQKARDLNVNIAVHMIGDKAVEMVLDAIEANPPNSGHDRLIHVSFLREDLIERMEKLDIICDIQPMFVASDFPWAIDRVGNERVRYSYPWKTLLNKGIICGGGSDSPIEDYRPLTGIDAAVNRKAIDDTSDGYNMVEALDVFEAISLYTTEAAKVANNLSEYGTIEVGKVADFTILRQNPFEVERNAIHKIEVAKTVIDGKIVFES
ncbi:amidohydrolase [Macrococcus animalis]|uniref:amidohydrolase n=1 Tax=Macrococcus animalis TaxID=3395467 RepID=UPI0039BDFBBE